MYVKYINSNMYARYGDNVNNEYLEKTTFFVQLEGFVSKFLESNAIIKVPADKSNIDILCHKSMDRQHE